MYSYKGLNTNSIESFWAIVKRGIIGQYHSLSDRYLPNYIDEFCFKYNNCKFDDESKSDNGIQTIPRGLSVTTNGLPPSMTAITVLTDETDMESRRSGDESSFCPGQLPDKSEDAESTQDSTLSAVNLPGSEIRKEKNSNFSMGDNVATSDPGSSNSWSVDISLHSAESCPITPRYTPMSAHLKELDREESQDNDNLKVFETDVEEKEDLEVLS